MHYLNEQEFIKLKDKSKSFSYSSFEYIEYADIHNYKLVKSNDSLILLLGKNREAKIYEYIWAANEATVLLKSLTQKSTFYLSFIPNEWHAAMELGGLQIRNAWHDYFISRLDLMDRYTIHTLNIIRTLFSFHIYTDYST